MAAAYNARVMKILLTVGIVALSCPLAAQGGSKVRVGYCTGLKNLEAAKAAGFDYVELSATEVAELSDAEFDAAVARIKELGIATPAANLFIPANIKITGPETDPAAQM